MSEPELRSTSPWMFRLLAAGTFLVGLVLGGLVTWVGTDSDQGAEGSGDNPVPTDSATTPSSDPTQTAAQSCLEAAEAVEEAVSLIRGGAAAIRDFQPTELVEILNQLEDLDPRVRTLAERCSGGV
ncbi:hypothetical protein BH24ACT12_BH24ACT12_08480 [soil metagenome]